MSVPVIKLCSPTRGVYQEAYGCCIMPMDPLFAQYARAKEIRDSKYPKNHSNHSDHTHAKSRCSAFEKPHDHGLSFRSRDPGVCPNGWVAGADGMCYPAEELDEDRFTGKAKSFLICETFRRGFDCRRCCRGMYDERVAGYKGCRTW